MALVEAVVSSVLPMDDLSIDALRSAYSRQTLRPSQLVEALYTRIERDALSGEWIHLVPCKETRERAHALEARADRDALPLYGIPFGVKDNIDVAGMPTTAGCPAYSYTPLRSAPIVDALLAAGALCLGKLNLDQFATGLVGTRSPYGVARNVFRPEYLAGGSSSGSAIAVAAHHLSFSLATDTAGSGRVPAALNNIVGLKPTVGRVSTDGVVPACASLDCPAVFALCVADAVRVRNVIEGRPSAPALPHASSFRFGIPHGLDLIGDSLTRETFARSREHLVSLGGTALEINFSPFSALGDLLYGPFVWERHLAVGAFIEAHAHEVLPITREIILGAKRHSTANVMIAMQLARTLRDACLASLREIDVLVLPTVPMPARVEDDRRDPRGVNDRLGIYTRFANFVGCPVLSVPQDFRADGLPSSVSLVGRPGEDARLDALGDALHRLSDAGMGKGRKPAPRLSTSTPAAAEARLAVVGLHMRNLPLNDELLRLGARYVTTTRTASSYRLWALSGHEPERPGLVRTSRGGVAIEVELWDLSWQALGELLARVPPPLAIGSLELVDGSWVRGFLCEASATETATDISSFGGYRAYLAKR